MEDSVKRIGEEIKGRKGVWQKILIAKMLDAKEIPAGQRLLLYVMSQRGKKYWVETELELSSEEEEALLWRIREHIPMVEAFVDIKTWKAIKIRFAGGFANNNLNLGDKKR
jgi:hypothetical protein